MYKCHGGKSYLKKLIISQFPENYEDLTFIEGCVGGASVLLNKKKSKREIINDLDEAVYNLFCCLKNHTEEFIAKVSFIEYSKESFLAALHGDKTGLDGAVNELVARRMSRGGLKNAFSWSERKRGGKPGDVNAWNTFKQALPLICERLSHVEIKNENVADLVHEWQNDENVLWYIDPPYMQSSRTCKQCYDVEMSEGEHLLLAQVLQETKGKVILSGYYSKLYAKLYKGWKMVAKEVANHASQAKKKQRRIEVLWMNYTT